jgi:hypothetical protein
LQIFIFILAVRDTNQAGALVNLTQSGNVDQYYFGSGQPREREDAINNRNYGILSNDGNQKAENNQITEA